jgi:hypothetical protein
MGKRLVWLASATAVAGFAVCVKMSAAASITEQDAVRVAIAFVKSAGIAPDAANPWITKLTWRSGWDISYPSYKVQVDAVTGRPINFSNAGRIYELVHNIGRTGQKRFKSRAEAEVYIRALARRLGLPSGWKLALLSTTGQAARRGEIQAAFFQPLHGYRCLSGADGVNGMTIALDVQDGVLKYWDMVTGIIVDRPILRISKQQAMRDAQKAYTAYYSNRRSFHGGPLNASGVRLGYATSGAQLPAGARLHARLVWEVPFGTQPVRVDAETGDVQVAELQLK